MSALSSLRSQAAAALDVVRFIWRPCTLDEAKTRIRARVAVRETLFLNMIREVVWAWPASPYRRLLEWAGWPYERIADSVRRDGIEETLRMLRDAGVYVTHEEFKGRVPIRRAGIELLCREADFDNPVVLPSFEVRTSGTRSRGSSVPATLGYIADQRGPAWRVMLEALGVWNAPVIVWMHSRHGSGQMWWLALANMGKAPLRWFSIIESTRGTSSGHVGMFRLLSLAGRLRGMRLPPVEAASLNDAGGVLDAVLEARKRYGACAVVTTSSAATRMATLAERRGVTLERVTFLVGAEPLTPGKHADIVRAGARVGVRYSVTEAGALGSACGSPATFDDVHLMSDAFALVRRPRAFGDGGSADAFLMTSLLPTSPRILLNAEIDDFGDVTERRCGCIWDDLGMHTHISNIRSFSKLTGEGLTLLGTDVVRVLEEMLPHEFGGRSLDYQLLEVEDEQHLTRLHLVVSPSVGPVDEARLLARFVEALGNGSKPSSFILPPLWEQAGTIRVVRREPVVTAGGKLLSFHTQASLTAQGRVAEHRGAAPE